jgi:hypothetical protein
VQAGAYSGYVALGLMKWDLDHSGEEGGMNVAEFIK